MSSLHLMKLCVGVSEPEELRERQRLFGRTPSHVTRMFPKRRDELLDGGSLYWIIGGVFSLRQRIVGLEPVMGADEIARCRITLEPELMSVAPIPRRPFQGWRYLKGEDAPGEISADGEDSQALTRALSELGLL